MRRGFLLGRKQDQEDPPKHAKTGNIGGGEGGVSANVDPSNSSGNAPGEAAGTNAQEALAHLENLCENPRARVNPPNMDYIWEDDYEEELLQRTEAALSSGVAPVTVQQIIAEVAEQAEVGYVPEKVQRAINKRLSLDASVGGQTYLHHLFEQGYPPEAWEEEGEELSLPQLLKRNPTPNLQNEEGETILHVLIRRTIDGSYFPDDSISGSMHSGDIERWEQRADYFEPAFKMLVDAGWKVHIRDAEGVSVLERLGAAKAEAQRLVDDPKIKDLLAEYATIPWLRAAGEESVEKLLNDRKSMLQAFVNALLYVEEQGLA